MMMKQSRFSDPTLLRSDVGRQGWTSNIMVHLDHASNELDVMHASEHAESLVDMRSGSLVDRTWTHSLRRITVI